MSRSQVMLELSARAAARQSRGRPWASPPPKISSSSGIRNRPALPSSSLSSTGKSQPVNCIRTGKAALQASSSSPKVPSRPFHKPSVQIAMTPILRKAKSVMGKLRSRQDRIASARPATVCPPLKKASDRQCTPPETLTPRIRSREPHRCVGASFEKQLRPALDIRARNLIAESILVESLFPPTKSPESSITTGRSFSIEVPVPTVAPTVAPTTPRRRILRPLMAQAPRIAKFREAVIRAVNFPRLFKSKKALPKGILKKAGVKNSDTAKRAVAWAPELEKVAVVDRWIGCSVDVDSPEKVQQVTAAKYLDVHPDPTRYLGRIRGWTNPSGSGEDDYIFGSIGTANHAECKSPDCNKKTLHQYKRVASWHVLTGVQDFSWPIGEPVKIFNNRLGYTFSSSPRSARQYPKDRGLFDD